ncbi:1,4-dihydroxy-2-naphthoyl-CoA hydrolase [compost metagenome]|jgi:acyl-CoA thioester hydrolase|uniref:acyl-CoA thioesterase n=1 Tax=Achromobacter sp. Root83 TaxID=1736602 RepID=UPI0009EC97A0
MTAANARTAPTVRRDYPRLLPMTTRLRDTDVYGHMNNVVYNEYFDTAVNQTLIELGVLDLRASDVIGLVVHSQTSYFRPVAFPDTVVIGVRVGRLGRTSVTYEYALFRGQDDEAAAQGSFTHAYVGRESNRPVELPQPLRAALEPLLRATP